MNADLYWRWAKVDNFYLIYVDGDPVARYQGHYPDAVEGATVEAVSEDDYKQTDLSDYDGDAGELLDR